MVEQGGRIKEVAGRDNGMVDEMTRTRRIVVEVEVPEELGEDFVETLRSRAWELYLTYKWLQLPEAPEKLVEELAREAKRRAAEKIR